LRTAILRLPLPLPLPASVHVRRLHDTRLARPTALRAAAARNGPARTRRRRDTRTDTADSRLRGCGRDRPAQSTWFLLLSSSSLATVAVAIAQPNHSRCPEIARISLLLKRHLHQWPKLLKRIALNFMFFSFKSQQHEIKTVFSA